MFLSAYVCDGSLEDASSIYCWDSVTNHLNIIDLSLSLESLVFPVLIFHLDASFIFSYHLMMVI